MSNYGYSGNPPQLFVTVYFNFLIVGEICSVTGGFGPVVLVSNHEAFLVFLVGKVAIFTVHK